MPSNDQLTRLLQRYFGYSEFRSQQREIIEHVLEGKDAIVLMPTGGGKSICYQLPALGLPGMAIIISPLIALMRDQVQTLETSGIAAAYLNSSLTQQQQDDIKNKIRKQEVKLLYVSPEKVYSRYFIDFLKELKISLFAIDEAHCVSSWGHHFRPEYKKLSVLKDCFPDVPVIGLTATADKTVRHDIGLLLHMHRPKLFISSFDRSNLSLNVIKGHQKWEKIKQILDKHHGQPGIIYCSSRIGAEKLSQKINALGYNSMFYHAGMENRERNSVQDRFIHGDLHIICATIAFGMGIDKPDIRFIIHNNMPGNIESYYQEIGRAGRDGLPSDTYLFYSYRDVQTHMKFIDEITDIKYREVQQAKLMRMQEYAEGKICRRRNVLAYFGEFQEKECSNCDVCENPPKYFDGTIQAQMALSAIHRLKEQIDVSMLIDVLKGKKTTVVANNHLHTIPTFGVGKDIPVKNWQDYIQQMIHQGIIEIDYKDYYKLKINKLSRDVLLNKMTINLIEPTKLLKTKSQPVAQKPFINKELFEHLKKIRKEIAEEIKKPAFVVFNDATLREITEKQPESISKMMEINGIGEYKAIKFGQHFIDAIQSFTRKR